MISNARRLEPEERKLQLLRHAVAMAEIVGYSNLTCTGVASSAGLRSHAIVNYYFGSVKNLKKEVFNYALKNKNLEIILQSLIRRDTFSTKIPSDLRQQALTKFSNE